MLVDNSASFSALTLLLFSSLWTFSLDCSGIIALWDWYFITLIQRRRRIITIIDLDEKRMISANTRLYRINMLFTTTLNKLKKGGLLRRILYSDWQLYIIMCYARVLPFLTLVIALFQVSLYDLRSFSKVIVFYYEAQQAVCI